MMQALAARLDDWLACRELREDARARLACAALLLFYCDTFNGWYFKSFLSAEAAWSLNHLPSWVFDPVGGPALMSLFWTRLYLSMLFLLALGGVLLLFRKAALAPVLILAFLLANKGYFYFSDLRLVNDAHQVHLILTLVFLAAREKVFFVRLALAVCYFLFACARLSPPGLETATAASLAAAAWQLLGPLLWLAPAKSLRCLSVAGLAALHASAAPPGGLQGAILMLPMLFGAFWGFDRPVHAGCRFSRAQLPGWAALGAVALAGLWHFAIPGDVRLTGEGRLLGFSVPGRGVDKSCRVSLHMGEGRRLVFTVDWPAQERARYSGEVYRGDALVDRLPPDVVVRADGRALWNPAVFLSLPAHAVEPYLLYSYGRRLCRDYRPERLDLEFSARVGPRGRAASVALEDFCRVGPAYRPFWRNAWIQLP